MIEKIILKRSDVHNKVPTVSDLEHGEIAINYTDGKLYYKNNTDIVKTLNEYSGNVITDSLVNGDKSVALGTDGSLTFSDGAIIGSSQSANVYKQIGNDNPTVVFGSDLKVGVNQGIIFDLLPYDDVQISESISPAIKIIDSQNDGHGPENTTLNVGRIYHSYGDFVIQADGSMFNNDDQTVTTNTYGNLVLTNIDRSSALVINRPIANEQGFPTDGTIQIRFDNGAETTEWTFGPAHNLTFPEGSSLGIPEGSGTFGFVCAQDTEFLVETSNGDTGNTWSFGPTGILTLPNNAIIEFDRNNTSISVGMGFHIRSGEGISLEAADQGDSTNLVTRNWYAAPDGTLNAPSTNNYRARAAITVINFPAEDTGFGLTDPNGLTYTFKYDYDGSHGEEIPILIIPGVDSVQDVVNKTITAINSIEVFGEVHWDPVNNCIWVYQYNPGTNGDQENVNYGYSDGITAFTGAANGAIVFGDGTTQTTAYNPDNQLIHQWTSPNNVSWNVKQYNGGFSGTYSYASDPLLWWNAANIPGLENNVWNFRGAIIEFHAFVNGKTVVGTVWIASDNWNSGDLTQVANAHTVFAGNQNDFAGIHFDLPWNSDAPSNPVNYMSHQLGYYNDALTEGQSDTLMVMWTSRVFIGGEYYC